MEPERRAEDRLKILPAWFRGCYGTSSNKKGDHDNKKNALRDSPNYNCRKSGTNANQSLKRCPTREPVGKESPSETNGCETTPAPAPFTDSTQEDPIDFDYG
jgi:hypothetical protein